MAIAAIRTIAYAENVRIILALLCSPSALPRRRRRACPAQRRTTPAARRRLIMIDDAGDGYGELHGDAAEEFVEHQVPQHREQDAEAEDIERVAPADNERAMRPG